MRYDLPAEESLCKRLKKRLAHMKTERASYESHWQELQDHFAPRSGRWINGDKVGSGQRGRKRSQKIINSTPLFAVNTLAAGMTSGNTSPARPWFRLTTPDPALAETGAVKQWLYAVEMRMREVFSRSNLYRVLPTVYRDLGVYGTAVMLELEDEDDIIRFEQLEIGSFWIAQSKRKAIDVLYREFQMTVRQLVQAFGLDACSERVQNMARNGQWESWVDVCHAIEPNDDAVFGAGNAMAIRSVYWESASKEDKLLAERGFRSSPLLGARWTTSGEEIYGSSPGMDALGDAKALQFKELRKAEAIDKVVNPPLIAPTSLRNQKISLLPGDVTYVDSQQSQAGLKPLHDWRPDLGAINEDIFRTEELIKKAFYVDLFLMMQNDTRSNITAREIQERHEEKLLMLGPVVERLNDELLDPIIDRTFDILVERSRPYWEGKLDGDPLIPQPPEELAGVDLKVEFISVLAQAQKAVGISAMDNLFGFVASLAQMNPGVLDKVDMDQAIDERAEMLGVSPRIVVPDDAVAQMRDAKAQQAQQAAAMQQGMAMAGMARDLGAANTGPDTALGRALDLVGAGAAPGGGA